MSYKKYDYGFRKKEIKTLLYRRLDLKEKARYHDLKVKEILSKVMRIEKEIDLLQEQTSNL